MTSSWKQSIAETARTAVRHDLPASIVVFLVALPLCMGIAIASGASVAAGLVTGIVGGIITGMLSGSPLQVSGPAAGLTVLVYEAINRHGIEMLGPIVLIAGILQILAGTARLAQWFRAVSPAVIKGMLTGIGVLIVASQFHVMVDDKPKGSGLANLTSIPAAIGKGLAPPTLAPREERTFRTRALLEIGELHRRQSELATRAAERLPDHAGPEQLERRTQQQREALALAAAALAAEQREIADQLRQTANQLATFDADSTGRIEQAVQHAEFAQAALASALRDLEEGRVESVLESQKAAGAALGSLLESLKSHSLAAQIGILTIVLLLAWQAFVPRRLKVVPAPLVAILVATAATAALSLPVLFVQVPDRPLANLHFVTPALLTDVPWSGVLQTAIVMALIASAETLLCAVAVDQLHTGPRTRFDKELVAQGVGNSICGFLGALPMTGVIVRSAANVQAGARSRWSSVMHGVWLLVFVAGLSFVLRLVPTASLAAILVYTGYKLINPKVFKELWQYGVGEALIYLATVTVIVSVDLLAGVLTGVVLSAVKLVYTFSHLKIRLHPKEGPKVMLALDGAATFIRLPKLAAALEGIRPDAELHVDLSHLQYIDHACLDLFMAWARQHEAAGGRLIIDWDSMHARFRRDRNVPPGEVELRRSA